MPSATLSDPGDPMTRRFHPLLSLALAGCLFLTGPLPGLAGTDTSGAEVLAQKPTGTVLLTITGSVAGAAAPVTAQLDQAMLAALPQASFTTTTIWTEGPQTFTGVPLSALLAATGMTGRAILARAINDYSVEIPVETWPSDGPIVAYLRNGKPMSVREKGPLWIVYPYDARADYRSEVVYSRSIWQLDRLELKP